MKRLRQSLALSFAQKYTELAISTVSIIALARLLTPAEIGIYSVGAAVTALGHALRDFGVSNYLIQERDLTTDRIRTSVGVSIVVAWAIALLLFALSGPIASFYREPGLRDLLFVLSGSFLFIPFSSPILALLRRGMAFGYLYIINTAGALVHAATAITFAILGFSYMSIAWATLAAVITRLVGAHLFRPRNSHVMPSFKEWRRVASFGGMASVADIMGHIGSYAPDFILGRLLGFTAVGLFSRATGLIQIFNQTVMHAVMPVVLPTFASKHHRDEDLLEPYLRALSFVTVFAWPFFIFLSLMTFPIVRILFGTQWDAAIPLIRILCLAGIFQALLYLASPLFIAIGKVRINLKISVTTSLIVVILFIIGASYSLEAAAFTLVLSSFLHFIISYRYLRRAIGLSLPALSRCLYKSAITALLSGIPPAIAFSDYVSHGIGMHFLLALCLPTTMVTWLCCIIFLRHPIRNELVAAVNTIQMRIGAKRN